MKSRGLIGGVLCIAFVACANGGDPSYDDGQPGALEGGSGGDGGSNMDSSGIAADTGGGTQPDSGASGGDSGAQGDDGGGTSCSSTDQCTASATMLGTVAGDESGPTETAMGTASEWLRIDLQEKDSSITATPMKLTATLTSPAGTNFDLYAYLGSGPGSIVCTGAKAQSTNGAGQTDTLSFEWGETGGGLANGTDDSATVMLEVRWIAGTCGSTDQWTLSAHGH